MAMFDQTDATLVLKAELNATNYTAPTTVKTRLGTSAPTATSNMTELSGSRVHGGRDDDDVDYRVCCGHLQLHYGDVDERGVYLVDRGPGDLGHGRADPAFVGDLDGAAGQHRGVQYFRNCCGRDRGVVYFIPICLV